MKKISLLIVVSLLLLAPLAAQSVKVVSPNGGESWVLNSSHAITWTPTNPGLVKVDIILRRTNNTKVGVIKSQVSLSAGSWPWTVGKLEDGTMAPAGTDYIVRIRDGANTFGDDSNAPFTISGATPPPPPPGGPASITVTTPNGGESWVKGGSRNITWNAVNFAGFVDLILKKLNEQSQKYETIGFIAKKVLATQGAQPWAVGTLLEGKTADSGGGYKVQVAKNYEGLLRPLGAPLLAGESDNSFSISFSASSAPNPLAMQLSVTAPAEGSEFDYSSFIINGQRSVKVPVRWTSESAGPFEFFLREAGKTAETMLKPVKAPVGVGNKTYEAEFNFTNKNTTSGLRYKIRVKSAQAGGISGTFTLKYKLWDVTLEPAFYDRHRFVKTGYSQPGTGEMFKDATFGQIDPSMAGSARVGFRNYFIQGGVSDYLYNGYLYRSRVVFDFSQFKNKKGEFKQAKVVISRSKYQGSSQMDPADCCAQVYILAEPWPGSDWLAIPGTILQNYPTGNPTNFDIPDWAAAWTNGSSPNHGMLVVGTMQSMNHDNLYCVTYYKIRLKVQFQEKD